MDAERRVPDKGGELCTKEINIQDCFRNSVKVGLSGYD